MKRHLKKRGAVVVIMAFTLLFLGILALGAFHLARLEIGSGDAQRTADSYALSVAEIYRGKGANFGDAAARDTAELNVRSTRENRMSVNPKGVVPGINKCIPPAICRSMYVEVDTQMTMKVPALAFANKPVRNVSAHSYAAVDELHQIGVQSPKLDIVLVLDYSCSMSGGPMLNQKQAVKHVLNKFKNQIAFSAVLFSSGIDGSVQFPDSNDSSGNFNQLVTVVDGHDATGGTDTAAGLGWALGELNRRMNMQGKSDRQRMVILASDGQPNDANAAKAAASAILTPDNLNATIFSVAMGTGGASFMKEIANTHESFMHPPPGGKNLDEVYALIEDPNNSQKVVEALEAIILRMMCNIPDPFLSLPIADCVPGLDDCFKTMTGFLKVSGLERGIRKYEKKDGTLPPEEEIFRVEGLVPGQQKQPQAMITFSRKACFARRDGAEFILRYNHPRLVAKVD